MKLIYLEFLTELYIYLKDNHQSFWAKWMKKSIDKFNENEDVSYFFSAFGGMGSFNDICFDSVVPEILSTITYCCAENIQENTEKNIKDILNNEKNRLSYNLKITEENIKDILPTEKERLTYNVKMVDYYKDCIKYVTFVLDNYKEGNLHSLTEKYLINEKK